MTGCPNGCARPAVAEVGIVGRTKSTYDVYVGGGPRGDRLATLFREKVPFADGYGVELGLLVDVARRFGAASIAQVDLGLRVHRNRPLDELRPQATEILRAALSRAGWPLPEQP